MVSCRGSARDSAMLHLSQYTYGNAHPLPVDRLPLGGTAFVPRFFLHFFSALLMYLVDLLSARD